MENSTGLSEYKTEYELLVEKLTREGKVRKLSEKESNQILGEIYGPDANGKTLSDLIRENSLKIALSELELRDILLAT